MRAFLQQLLRQCAIEHACERSLAGTADDDGGHRIPAGVGQQFVHHRHPTQQHAFAAEAAREREALVHPPLMFAADIARVHEHHGPGRLPALGDLAGDADQVFAVVESVDRGDHATPDRHRPGAARRHRLAHVGVDAIGDLLHGQVA